MSEQKTKIVFRLGGSKIKMGCFLMTLLLGGGGYYAYRYVNTRINEVIKHIEKSGGKMTRQTKDAYKDMARDLFFAAPALIKNRTSARVYKGESPLRRRFFGLTVRPDPDFKPERVIETLNALGVQSAKVEVTRGTISPYTEILIKRAPSMGGRKIDFLVQLIIPGYAGASPKAWRRFAKSVFTRYRTFVTDYEIGIYPNRPQWTRIRTHYEYVKIFEAVSKEAENIPGVRVIGPAAYGFEPYWINSIAKRSPSAIRVISNCLFVDHLGEPEEKEHGFFDLNEKIIFLGLIGRRHGSNQFWITRVNWALSMNAAQARILRIEKHPPEILPPRTYTESQAAQYMVRYYVAAAATGFVDRIYWHTLREERFGLMDNKGVPRLTYDAYRNLIYHLTGMTFDSVVAHPEAHIYRFSRPGSDVYKYIGWTRDRTPEIKYPVSKATVYFDVSGRHAKSPKTHMVLTPSPKYWFMKDANTPAAKDAKKKRKR